MTSFKNIFKKLLDRTGKFVYSQPSPKDVADYKRILLTRIENVLACYGWPHLQQLEKIDVLRDEDGRCYIDQLEYDLIDIYNANPIDSYDAESILGYSKFFNGKIYLQGCLESVWVNYVKIDLPLTEAVEVPSFLVECLIEFALSDIYEMDGKKEECMFARNKANRLEEIQMNKVSRYLDTKIYYTKR